MGQLSELLVQMAAQWQQHFLLNDMVEPKAGTREAGALGSMELGPRLPAVTLASQMGRSDIL